MTIHASFHALFVPALLSLSLAGPGATAADDPARHNHGAGSSMAMDAEGKRLESYDQRHEMTPEMRAALRKKVALYRGMTDR